MKIRSEDLNEVGLILAAASPPVAPSFVGEAIRHLVPDSWDGLGEPPVGWSRAYGIEAMDDGTIVVTAPEELLALIEEFGIDE